MVVVIGSPQRLDARLLLAPMLPVDENPPAVQRGIVALRVRPVGLLAAAVLEEGVAAAVAGENVANQVKGANLAKAAEELWAEGKEVKILLKCCTNKKDKSQTFRRSASVVTGARRPMKSVFRGSLS